MSMASLPDGWCRFRLDDASRIIRGASPRPKGDPRFYGGPVPRLMVEDVTRDGKTVFPSVDSLTIEGAKRSRPCPAGTLTLVCSGVVGVPSFLGVDACIHDGFIGLVDIKPGFSSDFIYHQLRRLQAEFDASATHGGVFTNLTTKGVAAFSFDAPVDKSEQEAIAEALSDADALIEGLERLIAKKRGIKQGAMQDLLTAKRRLPGFSGEWVETSFGQCFQFMRTGSASRSQLGTNLGVGYIHYGDIHGMRSSVLDLSRTRLPEIAPEKVTTLSRVRDGDLVIADASEDVTDVGKSVEVRGVGGAAVVAGLHTFLLRGNPDIVADGFKGYLQFLRDVRAGIESIATGSSVYGISKKNLADLKFRVPPVDEQAAIGWLFHDMDAEIQALETRLVKARQIKEGMMQNLLTGRIRLV